MPKTLLAITLAVIGSTAHADQLTVTVRRSAPASSVNSSLSPPVNARLSPEHFRVEPQYTRAMAHYELTGEGPPPVGYHAYLDHRARVMDTSNMSFWDVVKTKYHRINLSHNEHMVTEQVYNGLRRDAGDPDPDGTGWISGR
jgi:hypothetical protein